MDRHHPRDTGSGGGSVRMGIAERIAEAVVSVGRDAERERVLSLLAETEEALRTGLSCEADRVKAQFAMILLRGRITDG